MPYTLVYGLSADPIHRAHSDLAVEAAGALMLRGYAINRVLIIPVYRRNLPKQDSPAPYEDRVAMCQIAAHEIAGRLADRGVGVEVSRIEEELAAGTDRPNYTVETLAALRQRDPANGLIFLMSSDLFSGPQPEFSRWHRPEEIARLAVVAIAMRPGYPPDDLLLERYVLKGGMFVPLTELQPAEMSAREIRARIAAGDDPLALAGEGLLLEGVAGYIREHHLYRFAGVNDGA